MTIISVTLTALFYALFIVLFVILNDGEFANSNAMFLYFAFNFYASLNISETIEKFLEIKVMK